MDINDPFLPASEEDDLDKLRADNQAMRAKLQEVLGGKLVFPENLDPKTERMVLRNLQKLARESQNGKTVTLYEYVGEPTYTPDQLIKDDAYSVFLENLLEHLKKNNVRVVSPDDVDEGELYRFITRKLFKVKVKDVHIPGMMYTFIFEESDQSPESDAKSTLLTFLKDIFSGTERPEGTELLHKTITDDNGQKHPMLVAAKRVVAFTKSFEEFEILDLKVKEVVGGNTESKLEIHFNISWKGYLGKGEYIDYEGIGKAKLKKSAKGRWKITALSFPGFSLI